MDVTKPLFNHSPIEGSCSCFQFGAVTTAMKNRVLAIVQMFSFTPVLYWKCMLVV